jgi:hypothetical protein
MATDTRIDIAETELAELESALAGWGSRVSTRASCFNGFTSAESLILRR